MTGLSINLFKLAQSQQYEPKSELIYNHDVCETTGGGFTRLENHKITKHLKSAPATAREIDFSIYL